MMPNLEFPPNLRITSIRRKPVKATAAMPTTTYTCAMTKLVMYLLERRADTDNHTKTNAKHTQQKPQAQVVLILFKKADFQNDCYGFNVLGSSIKIQLH